MIMTNQETINVVIEKLKDSGKLSFRNDDLYKLFIVNKDIGLLQSPQVCTFPDQFIETNFAHFKEELLDSLTRNKVYYIMGDNDFLDIFISKEVFDDYKYVYMIQEEIDRLDIIVSTPNIPRKERIISSEKMRELSNKRSSILKKYGDGI